MTEAEALLSTGLLLGLIALALGLTVTGYILKKSFLAFAATGAWLLLAVFSFSNGGATFDIYWALAILSGTLALASAFVPLSFREAMGGPEEEEDADMADLRRFSEERRREKEQYGFLFGGQSRRRRPPKRGTSLYR